MTGRETSAGLVAVSGVPGGGRTVFRRPPARRLVISLHDENASSKALSDEQAGPITERIRRDRSTV